MKNLLFLLLTLSPLTGRSQDNVLQKRIGITIRDLPAGEALQQLEKATGAHLAFPSSLLSNPDQKVNVKNRNISLERALISIFTGKQIRFEVIGKRIHILEVRDSSDSTYILSGYLLDASSGEALIGATITFGDLPNTGTTSNSYGYFSLDIPAGIHQYSCSYLGYEPFQSAVEIKKDHRLNIKLSAGKNELQEIIVKGPRTSSLSARTQMGVYQVNLQQWKNLPAFAGEPDIMKMLQLLPGVKSVADGSTGIFVRGGRLDQNLILLDEAPVYNPSHLLGFFSVFNPDAIRHASFFKGGFPIEYGGRLSSVVDLKMREGNREKTGVKGSIGTLTSRILVEGPLGKSASMMISARRTYPDLILRMLPDNGGNKIFFYDLNGKANIRINNNDHIFLSAYFGRDAFRFFNKYENTWGNHTATLRWNHIFGTNFFSNFSLVYSRYRYFINNLIDGQTTFNWQTGITDLNLKTDLSWRQNNKSQFKFGLNSILHRLDPGSETQDRIPAVLQNKALETTLYAGHELELTNRLHVSYGLRFIHYNNLGPATIFTFDQESLTPVDSTRARGIYNSISDLNPRVKLAYQLSDHTSVRLSYSRMVQHQQELRNSPSPFSAFYIWMGSGPNIPAQRADQVSLGVYCQPKNKNWTWSAEIYFKKLHHQIDFVDHARLLQNPYPEQEIRVGKGRAFGIELMLEKTAGRLTGMLNYTYSRTLRKISGINNGKEYPAYYDQPHEAGISGQYQLSDRWIVSASWQYASGKAVNLPVGSYRYENTIVPIYGERNSRRLPDFHRLDLSGTLRGRKKPDRKFEAYWTFSIQNVYNRKNALSVDIFPYRDTTTGNVPDPTDVSAYKTYLFGIIPSLSYNFKF